MGSVSAVASVGGGVMPNILALMIAPSRPRCPCGLRNCRILLLLDQPFDPSSSAGSSQARHFYICIRLSRGILFARAALVVLALVCVRRFEGRQKASLSCAVALSLPSPERTTMTLNFKRKLEDQITA